MPIVIENCDCQTPRGTPRFLGYVAILIVTAALSGCMHRTLTIRSDPPGAAVMVDGVEAGYTPTSIDYTYYGTREITLTKNGYQTLSTPLKLQTPWYEVFPLDLISDNFALQKINDRRDVTYVLQRENIEPTKDVENRANNLRSEAMRSDALLP
jgi:PEGA domain